MITSDPRDAITDLLTHDILPTAPPAIFGDDGSALEASADQNAAGHSNQ
jgi:hypothetical protein